MSAIRPLMSLGAAAVSVAALVALPGDAAAATTATTAQQPMAASWQLATPRLVDIRAAHHRGLDRLVFQFQGKLPAGRSVQYVKQLIADASGKSVTLVGDALLQIRFTGASGHTANGTVSFGPTKRTYALPGIIQVARTGDFEGVLTFGVSLARREPYRVYTLTHPSRVVIDITTPYRTVPVRDYFLNSRNYATGQQPYTTDVRRPVIAPATAKGALQRLFAGPTQTERAAGLRLVTSGATGFSKVTIRHHVARVYLTGPVAGGGSTFTIADQIFPTLKQFPSIRWVKIYDATGHTEHPTGPTDSVPEVLEP